AAKSKGHGSPEEDATQAAEIKRLKVTLAKTEAELTALKASEDGDGERRALEARIAELEAGEQSATTEIAKLKAALKAYEEDAGTPAGIAQKADIGALQAEVDEQRRTIESLRAEIAASQERHVRQALHFHEELRRMGHSSTEGAGPDS